MITNLQKTPEQEITDRIFCLKQKMESQNIEAVFLTHKPDIFYFSGTAQDCYVYISLEHEPALFVKRYYPRAKQESCLKNIFQIDSIKSIPGKIKNLHQKLPKTCGIAFNVVPVRDFNFYQTLFHSTDFTDCAYIINECRQIKSGYEIDQIKKAGILSEKTFAYIKEHIRPGISEMEFAGEFETFARRLGHSGILLNRHYRADGFPFHLLSGENGGLPGSLDSPCCGTGTSITHPYGAGTKILQRDEPILIDFGTVLNGYHMDETRMFAMGSMEQDALDVSKASLEILYSILSLMKPGIVMGDIFDHSLQLAKNLDMKSSFSDFPT